MTSVFMISVSTVCCYAEFHFAEHLYTECPSGKCINAEHSYAECPFGECC